MDVMSSCNNVDMRPKEVGGDDTLVRKIMRIYDDISKLPSLKPCKNVDTLFTELVLTCIPPTTVQVSALPPHVQHARSRLIRLCAEAEGLLESHYSSLLCSHDEPHRHLHLFPYYNNYLKLALLEHTILSKVHGHGHFRRVAFIGSGPMPLTSIVLARNHMRDTTFHNYDVDPAANARAARLVAADPDLSKRMVFHTRDVMDVGKEMREYDVVFLAALVGMDREEKKRVVEHLAENMAPGAVLMLRSAAGARAFLYPIVEESDLGGGFELVEEYHPSDEVINSVILARRKVGCTSTKVVQQQQQQGMVLPCKCCSEVVGFGHGATMEELVVEEAS